MPDFTSQDKWYLPAGSSSMFLILKAVLKICPKYGYIVTLSLPASSLQYVNYLYMNICFDLRDIITFLNCNIFLFCLGTTTTQDCFVICWDEFENTNDAVQVTKGVPNLTTFSQLHGANIQIDCLNQKITKYHWWKCLLLIHSECRIYRDGGLKRNNAETQPATPKHRKLRSSIAPFDWKSFRFSFNIYRFSTRK